MSMGYLNRSPIRLAAILTAALAAGCGRSTETSAEVAVSASSRAGSDVSSTIRDDALAAARVWTPPATPVSGANLRDNPPGPGAFREDDEVTCRFELKTVGGLTPKFYCVLPSGDAIKVKYGSGNGEVHA